MGAPTTPRKRTATKKKSAAEKAAAIAERFDDDLQLSEQDINRLTAETEDAFRAADVIGEDGEIRPIEIGKAGREGPDRAHLFTLEGEKFFINKTPSPAVLLRFMRESRDKRVGRDQAVENAMLSILGKRALNALSESEDLADEEMAAVVTACLHVLFGAIKRWRAAADPTSSAPPN